MSGPFRSPEDYELFLYTLPERFPSIQRSTLTFVRRGLSLARVTGELFFNHEIRLVILERIVFDRLPLIIDAYGYEVWQGDDKLYWYDPQPHPNESSLQSTHPHHKHVPPDIKHHRIPAPGLSFSAPNLPLLIEEVERMLAGSPTLPSTSQSPDPR
ncbi:MAG: hypothetical protein QOF89_2873 [Acidobacteriota bacterium]|jgi:hypothetical protein|nr:hypothetical protein [Acidobacteriota bacterium]